MRNLFIVIIIIAIFYGYNGYKNGQPSFSSEGVFVEESYEIVDNPVQISQPVQLNNNLYSCNGRQHCSQMTSCEEATYYINHCPNTKMDGDNDGVPCEKQWCR